MQAIRKARNLYALFLLGGVVAALWFAWRHVLEAALVFGVISVALFVFLVGQNRRLYLARLIWDNPILAVTSAVVLGPEGAPEREVEETVVSTFGLLIGDRIYSWGHRGVKLNAVEIDQRKVHVRFGSGAQMLHIELLHGLTDARQVAEVQQKLWRETGVIAQISGW